MLPKIDKPLFELEVPSFGTTLMFHPFSVKDEKILLTAQQEGTEKAIVLAIKQVIKNCCIDETFDVNRLATFDLEYLFIKLRARSVNNIIDVSYRDNEDEKIYDFEVDLDQVEMIFPEDAPKIIEVNEQIGIKMKYPSVTMIDNAPSDASPSDVIEYLIVNCIESIYDGESVYPAKDVPADELLAWLDNLDVEVFTKIRTFFDKLPQMYYVIEYENSLGNKRKIEMTTLTDFFILG